MDYSCNIKYYKFHKRKHKKIGQITSPLKCLNIDNFIYLKIILDSKYQVICVDDKILQNIIFSRCEFSDYISSYLKGMSFGQLKMELIGSSIKSIFNFPINLNISQISGIAFFAKLETFSEVFIFSQYQDGLEILKNNLENTKFLKRFMIYFREEYKKMLKNLKYIPYALLLKEENINDKSKKELCVIKSYLPNKPFVLQKDGNYIVLSKQEALYLYLLSLGNKGITISEHMGVSFKRSNDILANIKKKTNLYDRTSLIKLMENY